MHNLLLFYIMQVVINYNHTITHYTAIYCTIVQSFDRIIEFTKSMITCPFTCIPIHIPLLDNETHLYALYDTFLVALSTQKRMLVSDLFIFSTYLYVRVILHADTVHINELCYTNRNTCIFVTLPRSELKKETGVRHT